MWKNDNYREFDRLIKDKMLNANVRPPEHLWNNIQSKIPIYSPWWNHILSPISKAIISSAISIGIIVSVYFMYNHYINDKPEIKVPLFSTKSERIVHEKKHYTKIYSPTRKPIYLNNLKTNINDDHQFSFTTNESSFSIADELKTISPEITNSMVTTNFLKDISTFEAKYKQNIFLPESMQKIKFQEQHLVFPLDKFIASSITLGYNPEIYIYDTTLFNTKTAHEHKFFASFQIYLDEFFLETGFSIGQSIFNNTYQKNIWYNHVVAQYERVDSVEFVPYWDPNTSSWLYEPIFYTSPVTITQIRKESYIETQKDKYIYAHIPFMLGIRKNFKHFCIEPRIGLLYTLLIFDSSKEFQVVDNMSSNIVREEQILLTATRLGSFWNFACSFSFSYSINNYFDFIVAPTYRYTLEPMFQGESPSRQAPVGLGISTGIRYKFLKP